MRKHKFIYNTSIQWLWLIALLVSWEIVARCGLVNTYILPPFSKVFTNMIHEIIHGNLGFQVLNSMKIILIGFLLSLAIASIFTLLSVWIPPIKSLFDMLCSIMTPLPAIAITPLIIMWFGIKTGAMLTIIVHGVLWTMLRHLLDGIKSIKEEYYDWGKTICLPPWRMFTDIIVPAIMQEFLAGIRVGWGRAWRALLSAEMMFGMIGNLGGLGYYIYIARSYANLTNVLSSVLIIVIIGMLVEILLFGQIERHTVLKWGYDT